MTKTEQPVSVRDAKRSWRRLIAERLCMIDSAKRRQWDAAIAVHVTHSEAFRCAPALVGYLGLLDEVNVDAVLTAAIERGKTVLVPVLRGEAMSFARWSPQTVLQRSRQGVLEATAVGIEVGEVGPALVLVPGRAFDLAGGRVGRGGGHYDRVLAARLNGVCLAGVGYELQVVESVPLAAHDRRVEMVFTEAGCSTCTC